MPNEAEYEAAIQTCDWSKLRALWERIETRTTNPEWDSGKAFEYLILRAFQLDDVEVSWPYRVRLDDQEIEQIDGAIHVLGTSFLVESKDLDQSTNVAIGPIAKLRNQLVRRPQGTFGIVFSRTGFTDPARLLLQYTSPQNVLLWSGHEIRYALDRERIRDLLLIKHRRCIEFAIPDFDVRLGVPA